MDTFTGRTSIQDALARDRSLFVAAAREPRDIVLDKVTPPDLPRHPWADMRKSLAAASPDEPLAHATPAAFYFIRSHDFGKLLDLADEVERFGEPAADMLDQRAQDRGTFARYETELGLSRTGAARVFGPALVTDFALVGSDPYLNEGTDLTLLFRVKSAALFDAALAGTLAVRAAAHGGPTQSSFVHEGITVTVDRSADGRVRRQRATVNGTEIVSNSAVAIRRVISTILGKAPALADEPDFDYMLARDAGAPDDVLAYMGDRFIASVVGPAQKIAEERRQIALSELSIPGYAGLLSGWLAGHAPKDAAEVIHDKLLTPSELRHADGAPIDWQPGHAASSKWGTVAALEPLIDLPEVVRVSKAEQGSYFQFAHDYQSMWGEHIDPVALRVRESHAPGGHRALSFDLRVLPLLRREYREYVEIAGAARILVPGAANGASVVLGIGKDAELRHKLTELGMGFLGSSKFALDWLGTTPSWASGTGTSSRISA